MPTVSIYVPDSLYDRIDEQRGDQSRSNFLQTAAKEKLEERPVRERLDEIEEGVEFLIEQEQTGYFDRINPLKGD